MSTGSARICPHGNRREHVHDGLRAGEAEHGPLDWRRRIRAIGGICGDASPRLQPQSAASGRGKRPTEEKNGDENPPATPRNDSEDYFPVAGQIGAGAMKRRIPVPIAHMKGARSVGHHPAGSGAGAIRLRKVPIPSTCSSTTSPGDNWRPSSRADPLPNVPDPIMSPG
jgi:hypothetical protein